MYGLQLNPLILKWWKEINPHALLGALRGPDVEFDAADSLQLKRKYTGLIRMFVWNASAHSLGQCGMQVNETLVLPNTVQEWEVVRTKLIDLIDSAKNDKHYHYLSHLRGAIAQIIKITVLESGVPPQIVQERY
jgi:hypothetical protein